MRARMPPRGTPANGRVRSARVLLAGVLAALLAVSAPAWAAPHHEDFRSATADYEALFLIGQRGLDASVRALAFALYDNHTAGVKAASDTDLLVHAMGAVVKHRGPVPSAAILAPFYIVARDLDANASRTVEEWADLAGITVNPEPGLEQALRGIHLLDEILLLLSNLDANADAYEALDYNVDDLRWLIDQLGAKLEKVQITLRDVAKKLAADPAVNNRLFVFVDADPHEVPLGASITFRGGVFRGAEPMADATLRILLDGARFAEHSTNARGGFARTHAIAIDPAEVGSRTVSVEVSVDGETLTASDGFVVTRIPTSTTLTAERPIFGALEDAILLVRVHPVPPPAPFTVEVDGKAAASGVTGSGGLATLSFPPYSFDLGCHDAQASYPGSAVYAPSQSKEADCLFTMATTPPTPRGGPADLSLFEQLFGPILGLILEKLVMLLAVILLALLVFLAVSYVRSRRAIPLGGTLAGISTAGVAPAVVAAIERRLAAVSPAPWSPLRQVVRAYARLLLKLARTGVDPRPLTPREIARIMAARGYPRAPVDQVTGMFERALYADEPLDPDAVASFEGGVDRLGGASS